MLASQVFIGKAKIKPVVMLQKVQQKLVYCFKLIKTFQMQQYCSQYFCLFSHRLVIEESNISVANRPK